MSTEPLQSETPASVAQPSTEGSALQPAKPASDDSASATNAAEPSSATPPLPPRIDPGEDLDNVLGEVSRMFGTAAGHAAPLAALAEDTINDHLADLTAVSDSESAGRAAPQKQNVPLDNAADLFRAAPPAEEPQVPASQPDATSPESSPNEGKVAGTEDGRATLHREGRRRLDWRARRGSRSIRRCSCNNFLAGDRGGAGSEESHN